MTHEDEKKGDLKEKTIEDLFLKNKTKYIIPIYQRNFAWGKDEIKTLVSDIYHASQSNRDYYIGTLVVSVIDNGALEVIDGQQRLTALYLLLCVLGQNIQSSIEFKTRNKSKSTLFKIKDALSKGCIKEKPEKLNSIKDGELDDSLLNGLMYTIEAVRECIPENTNTINDSATHLDSNDNNKPKDRFLDHLNRKVKIIHYQVPEDTDLNQYFEVMNSRGEQLEQHEVVKARLMEKIGNTDKDAFSQIWDNCGKMGDYIQSHYKDKFSSENNSRSMESLADILKNSSQGFTKNNELNPLDYKHFFPIIDFPNFLLIVLKITLRCYKIKSEEEPKVSLDENNLSESFDAFLESKAIQEDVTTRTKRFIENLLIARFFIDNYVVHHHKKGETNEDEEASWSLKCWKPADSNKHADDDTLTNLCEDRTLNEKLKQILSMFEVTYSFRRNKNYLVYLLYYLMKIKQNIFEDFKCDLNLKSFLTKWKEFVDTTKNQNISFFENYHAFLETLAKIYFYKFYLSDKRDSISSAIDKIIFECEDFKKLKQKFEKKEEEERKSLKIQYEQLFGKDNDEHTDIPAFIFNYLDYKIWSAYHEYLEGKGFSKEDSVRIEFFKQLGCEDFGLDNFQNFYFSRTRDSLEHYFPVANVKSDDASPEDKRPKICQANYFGNFALIGRNINSNGSDQTPSGK